MIAVVKLHCAHKNMEKNLKRQLIRSVNNIKTKVKQMRYNRENEEKHLNKMLKPITDPLNKIADFKNENTDKQKNINFILDENTSIKPEHDVSSNESECEEFEEASNHLEESIKVPPKDSLKICGKKYKQEEFSNNDDSDDSMFNIPFGIRRNNNELFIGNAPVVLFDTGPVSGKITVIKVGNLQYELTTGLKELLFQKVPDLNLISEVDKIVYKDILFYTNVHKRQYIESGQIKGDKSMKYCKIIKPLLGDKNPPETRNKLKIGGNLPTLKKYTSRSDFVYWDDPNELIERLKLLIASRDAGNNNHDNEIISIIEELKEASIIKQ